LRSDHQGEPRHRLGDNRQTRRAARHRRAGEIDAALEMLRVGGATAYVAQAEGIRTKIAGAERH
jgi:hypothetical protein